MIWKTTTVTQNNVIKNVALQIINQQEQPTKHTPN